MCLPALALTYGDDGSDTSATTDDSANIDFGANKTAVTDSATAACPALIVPVCGPYQELSTVHEVAGSCIKLVCGECFVGTQGCRIEEKAFKRI